MVADENLRHGAPAAAGLHLSAFLRRRFHVDLLEGHALRLEQPAGPLAVRAPAGGVHHDGRRVHQAALVTGRFSERQAAKPPRNVNALVNPCALSWRTAAAASEPESQYTTTGFSLKRLKLSPAVRIWSDGRCLAPLTWPCANSSGLRMSSTRAPWFMSRIRSWEEIDAKPE